MIPVCEDISFSYEHQVHSMQNREVYLKALSYLFEHAGSPRILVNKKIFSSYFLAR